jgi:hypothetical protein
MRLRTELEKQAARLEAERAAADKKHVGAHNVRAQFSLMLWRVAVVVEVVVVVVVVGVGVGVVVVVVGRGGGGGRRALLWGKRRALLLPVLPGDPPGSGRVGMACKICSFPIKEDCL